jgi:hypothetical protein
MTFAATASSMRKYSYSGNAIGCCIRDLKDAFTPKNAMKTGNRQRGREPDKDVE